MNVGITQSLDIKIALVTINVLPDLHTTPTHIYYIIHASELSTAYFNKSMRFNIAFSINRRNEMVSLASVLCF